MDEETRQTIAESALGLLGLPSDEPRPGSIEVVASLLATREPDDGMKVSIGRVLAERARAAIAEQAKGQTPVSFSDATVDWSDDANCKDLQGQVGNAFVRGERCYRMVLHVATVNAE
jgi:hypothetical protein